MKRGRRRATRIAVGALLAGILAYVAIFPLAEAFTEVVTLRTFDAAGAPHETRVTVIDRDGAPWVRGREYRGWFRRVAANPCIELRRHGVWQRVRAEISREPADTEAFNGEMLRRYGLAYRFVDAMACTSTMETPMRLVPREAGGGGDGCPPSP